MNSSPEGVIIDTARKYLLMTFMVSVLALAIFAAMVGNPVDADTGGGFGPSE